MQKIMFDTHEYDRLLIAPDAYDRLLTLLSERKIELLATHIQGDEIMAIEDSDKKTRLESLLTHARLIPTQGIVLDVSRLGLAEFGGDENHKLIEHVRSNRWDRDTKDALIAATAAANADVLVTDDTRLMKRLNSYPNIHCEVISFEEFERRITKA